MQQPRLPSTQQCNPVVGSQDNIHTNRKTVDWENLAVARACRREGGEWVIGEEMGNESSGEQPWGTGRPTTKQGRPTLGGTYLANLGKGSTSGRPTGCALPSALERYGPTWTCQARSPQPSVHHAVLRHRQRASGV